MTDTIKVKLTMPIGKIADDLSDRVLEAIHESEEFERLYPAEAIALSNVVTHAMRCQLDKISEINLVQVYE